MNFPMETSSSPDLGMMWPDICASVSDCGARVNEVVNRAAMDVMGMH
jgi:hypothetical protein